VLKREAELQANKSILLVEDDVVDRMTVERAARGST